MQDTPKGPSPSVLSYRSLRRSVGGIGMALPFVLAIGDAIIENHGLLYSLSASYHTVMRDVFVGSLCAIAVFLFSYWYERKDNIASKFAAVCAIGAALFPVAPQADATNQQMMIGWFHWAFSVGCFGTLAYFALVLFRKTEPKKEPTPRKKQRNRVYFACGSIMIACFVLLALLSYLPGSQWLQEHDATFWLESLAVEAFGVAWLVKGETVLKDKKAAVEAVSVAV